MLFIYFFNIRISTDKNNMEINHVTKQEFSFNLIQFLDSFFKDSRGYEFTLFCWPKKIVSKNIIRNDMHFTWKILDNKNLYGNGSASILFKEKYFKEPFWGCKTDRELSQKISQYISSCYFEEKEFSSNFNLVTGVNFYHQSWQDYSQKIFGTEEYSYFYIKQLSEKLSLDLTEKSTPDFFIKI